MRYEANSCQSDRLDGVGKILKEFLQAQPRATIILALMETFVR